MEKATELARKEAKITYMSALFESCLCSRKWNSSSDALCFPLLAPASQQGTQARPALHASACPGLLACSLNLQ